MGVEPHTRLAGECLQPLGHLSLRGRWKCRDGQRGHATRPPQFAPGDAASRRMGSWPLAPGGVAERSNAPVLKTGVRHHRTAGSNPAPSAQPGHKQRRRWACAPRATPAGSRSGCPGVADNRCVRSHPRSHRSERCGSLFGAKVGLRLAEPSTGRPRLRRRDQRTERPLPCVSGGATEHRVRPPRAHQVTDPRPRGG
jgi:hypothetical protein